MENNEKPRKGKWRGGPKKKDPEQLQTKQLKVFVTEAEYNQINNEFEASGLKSRSHYLRKRLLNDGKQALAINPIEFLKQLDKIGTEIGRIGNNMNQVAKYSHILAHEGNLSDGPVKEFNKLMEEYMKSRRELVKAYRAVVRTV